MSEVGGGNTARDHRRNGPSRIGQYLLQGELGHGGMGVVFRALHERLKKPVALKILAPGRMHDARALARFQKEMEVIASLDHPNIVRARDAGEVDGLHFLVMDLVEGANLSCLLRREGPLSVADACELVRQAALGLQHAHEHGLVHRDVKPSNLILDPSGTLKLVDLGVARLSEHPAGEESLTFSGEIVGTVDYMAPEQGIGGGTVDIRADLYSLGCTLYKLLTGTSPFGGPEYDSVHKKLSAHSSEPVPPIGGLRPGLPEGLEALLARLLAKDPCDRPSTPAEVASSLAPFAEGNDLPRLARSARGAATAAPGSLADGVMPDPYATTRWIGRDLPITEPAEPDRPAATVAARDFEPGPHGEYVGFRMNSITRPLKFLSPVGWRGRSRVRGQAGPWPALCALCLILLIGLIAGAVWARRSGPLAGSSASPRPGIPFPLLTTPPSALLWPDTPRSSTWHHDPDERSLLVHSEDTAIFRLGDSWDARRYSLAVTIHQTSWTHGVGIVFGWHTKTVGAIDSARFQTIRLREAPDQPDSFHLERTEEALMIPSLGINSRILRSVLIPKPAQGDHRLAITVGEKGLESVRWDGEEVPALVETQVNAKLTDDADSRGLFGVIIDANTSVFRKATFLRHPEPLNDPSK